MSAWPSSICCRSRRWTASASCIGLAPGQVKVALAPVHQYGPLILLAVLFLPPLRPFLDSFLSGGQEMVYGFLAGAER